MDFENPVKKNPNSSIGFQDFKNLLVKIPIKSTSLDENLGSLNFFYPD